MTQIIKKIPGALLPPPKSEIDGKITDLSIKSIPELLEIKERQIKLLSNRSFVSKLPDKGAKILCFHDKVVEALKSKQEEEKACKLLERLNINVTNDSIEHIEWKDKVNSSKDAIDSDDYSEPEDILQIISQNTATEKTLKILKPEKSRITIEDLETIGELPHIKYIVTKTECNPNPHITGQFKPYKTTKSDVHDPAKEILRKKHKKWENTAATPPPIIHKPAVVLGLEESLKLQKDYNIHLKEVGAQHAAEKLLERNDIKMSELPDDVSRFGIYRDVDSEHTDVSDDEGSDKELHDEEPERGGVIITVMK